MTIIYLGFQRTLIKSKNEACLPVTYTTLLKSEKFSSMIFPHFHPPNFLNSSMQNTHHLGQGDRQLTTYKNVMISNIENRY